ncbi:hypothetical protein [Anditalea andensis]|uniref:RHS repeat-associated core domain-containing protein n=1 Tax=Anditalea andensis TaxID=1048983 RepID=A0A074KS15_9BACT|nr:hypothetical protein [Anditalea andensis]KEO71674.1 hypothetical protein EL17_23230 [Anditalea andensis]
MTGKRSPAKDVEIMHYDHQDRPIASQNGNLRGQNKWYYTKYDALGRVIMTGITSQSPTGAGSGSNMPN